MSAGPLSANSRANLFLDVVKMRIPTCRRGTEANSLTSDGGWRTRSADPEGFERAPRENGDVVIPHYGRVATTLRGHRADEFVAELADDDDHELMARLTGNYKRGNERDAPSPQPAPDIADALLAANRKCRSAAADHRRPFEHLAGPFAECHERFEVAPCPTGTRVTHTQGTSVYAADSGPLYWR